MDRFSLRVSAGPVHMNQLNPDLMATALHSNETKSASKARSNGRWYACYTRARHEKRVAAALQERGIECFLPVVPRESQWKDRRRTVEWPMFPSYVFGRFQLTLVDRILSVPGVVTLVRAAGRPIAIPDEEIANVRRFSEALTLEDAEVEHIPYFAEGDAVEVLSGPFQGVRGVVIEDRGRQRVLIGLKEIGQGTVVDVKAATLRPLQTP